MSTQLLRQGIRLRADARSRQTWFDACTNATPQGWVRAATQFEIALASNGDLVDVSNLSSVTLEAAPFDDKDGPRVLSRTLPLSALDAGLTEATWADGSRQHALFVFSSGEMNVALSGADHADFWLVVTALTAAGDPIVCGTGKLILADDGTFNAAPPPPANPGAGITVTQADLRYAPLDAAWAWAAGVSSVGDGAPGSLENLPTAGLSVPALRTVYLPGAGGYTGELQDWLLLSGTDATADGQTQRPADFDPSTNPKVWWRKR